MLEREPAPSTSPSPAPEWHARAAEEVAAALGVDPARGLSEAEVRKRRAHSGANTLPGPKVSSFLSMLVGQLRNPLIYLLFGAGAVAVAIGETRDAVVILVVVAINAVVGALQEGRAQSALAALRRMMSPHVRVLRDGVETTIESRDLVPGDVVELAAGDSVPADGRLLLSANFQVTEASLTGESTPIAKSTAALPGATPLADRANMVFAGTHATRGRARAVLVATGLRTEIGAIASMVEQDEQPPTPLEQRIAQFGRWLTIGAGATFCVVMAIGFFRRVEWSELLLVAISQVVGLVPEGLPAAVTVALAVGVQRMARRRAIVRRLAAVETLGATTVILTDKTGTLTQNEMTVKALVLAEAPEREVHVSGAGYAPEGAFSTAQGPFDPTELWALLDAAVLCNDADLVAPTEAGAPWGGVGDPTEIALVTAARKAGRDVAAVRAAAPRRGEIPFDASTKMMATEHEQDGRTRVFLKGAFEPVLELCGARLRGAEPAPLDEPVRAALRARTDALAARALRVLAVAVVEDARIEPAQDYEAFRGRAALLGLIAEVDPLRTEAKAAVAACRAAGIRPVMVTGDHRNTATAIARELELSTRDDETVEGVELEGLSDEVLRTRAGDISVFARVQATQKLRIADAHRARGEVVAMTGDGVNDAPALVHADVGVAMGRSGTEVAKEAADVVITDDDFSTLVAAVEEGRLVYRNIQKVILFLFSTSLAEVIVLLLALALGYPPPFAAVQILWNNLVTEGSVALSLVFEPPEGDEMSRPPIPRNEPLLTRTMLIRLALMTTAISISTFGWFAFRLEQGVPFERVRTEAFTLLVVCEWFNVFNCRSDRASALDSGVLKNRWLLAGLALSNLLQLAVVFLPALNEIFYTVPFDLGVALAIGAAASLVLWAEELRKLIVRGVGPRRAPCPTIPIDRRGRA